MTTRSKPPPRCFQGVVPAIIATVAPDGTPNGTYLSQVFAVDDRHVALSCQFFNKTKRNVLANPHACVVLNDPVTFEAWRLELRFSHAEESGPLFDTMALRIQAIATHTGMKDVFRLISADVYEVLRCEKLEAFIDVPDVPALEDPGGSRSELRGLQLVSQQVSRATDLECLLENVLQSLEQGLGFEHAMFLMPDETGTRLFTVASRGYGDAGIGSEVVIGEGLIGTVAQQRRILRMSGVGTELRYGRAIRTTVEHAGDRSALRPEIPLPGLADAQSHLAIPLVVADRLVGVLAVESRKPLGFDEWDETFLEIIANQLAFGLDNALLRSSGKDDLPAADTLPCRRPDDTTCVRRFRFFRNDDCVFVDGEYLIRNVPGRILWKLLRAHVDDGRTEFSNRELRLDPWLGLPPVRDNLESRLLLLRKRLELKCPEIGLPSTSRGHFRMEARCRIEFEECDGA